MRLRSYRYIVGFILLSGCITNREIPSDPELSTTIAPQITTNETESLSPTTLPLGATPTPKIGITPYPTRNPLQPTPDFPAAQVASGVLFSTGQSPDCKLPCWNGLEVGKSTSAEIQAVFASVFPTQDFFDFFAPPPEPNSLLQDMLSRQDAYAGGHSWEFNDVDTQIAAMYSMYAYIDRETSLLTGLSETMHSRMLFDVPLLPQIVQALGMPDWIYGGFSAQTFGTTLFYEEGIIVFTEVFPSEIQADLALICLDDEPFYESILLVDSISYPDDEDKSLLRVGLTVPDEIAPYIDESFGLASIDEFMALVASDNPCLEIERPAFP